MLLKITAMAVQEWLASALTLSNALKHLKAISAKRSFPSRATLLNTSTHNTACDVCKKKILRQVIEMKCPCSQCTENFSQ